MSELKLGKTIVLVGLLLSITAFGNSVSSFAGEKRPLDKSNGKSVCWKKKLCQRFYTSSCQNADSSVASDQIEDQRSDEQFNFEFQHLDSESLAEFSSCIDDIYNDFQTEFQPLDSETITAIDWCIDHISEKDLDTKKPVETMSMQDILGSCHLSPSSQGILPSLFKPQEISNPSVFLNENSNSEEASKDGFFYCRYHGCLYRSSRSDLRHSHEQITHIIRPFSCPFEDCGRKYARKWQLQKHIEANHSGLN